MNDRKAFTLANSDDGGADVVLEVAGAKDTFRLAWDCAHSNAVVTVWQPSTTNPRCCFCLKCTAKT